MLLVHHRYVQNILLWSVLIVAEFQLLAFCSAVVHHQESKSLPVTDLFLQRLFRLYNKNQRPVTNSKLNISLQIAFRTIDFLDDIKQELGLQLTLRQQWIDKRLSYSSYFNLSAFNSSLAHNKPGTEYYINVVDTSTLWVPDLLISNEKRGKVHELLKTNIIARIYPNGTIILSTRMSVVLSCPMKLQWYPFDKHRCPLRLASYSFTNDELHLHWNPFLAIEFLTLDSFTRDSSNGQIQLANFNFIGHSFSKLAAIGSEEASQQELSGEQECIYETVLGEFSCVVVFMEFDRQLNFYLVSIFIPCVMIVVISWLSFWFDVGATDARIALGVTVVLTMASTTQAIIRSAPSVSYTKVLDYFTGFCMFSVTLALLEFAIVDITLRNGESNHHKINAKAHNSSAVQLESNAADLEDGKQSNLLDQGIYGGRTTTAPAAAASMSLGYLTANKKGHYLNITAMSRGRAKRVDLIARIGFPSVFLGFCIVYFVLCYQFSKIY